MTLVKFLQNRLSFVLIFTLLFYNASHAQVTIGSAINPVQGSLLDLKETEALEANSTKGLMLPRVSITQLNELKMGDNVIKDTDNDGDQYNKHIGLMVYNVNNNLCTPGNLIAEGVYVWAGDSWIEQTDNVTKLTRGTYWFTDNRDNQNYLAREFYYIDDDGQKVSAGDWMLQNLAYNPLLNPADGYDDYEESLGLSIDSGSDVELQKKKGRQKLFYYATGVINNSSGSGMPAGWSKMIDNGILYSYNAAINGWNNLAITSVNQHQITPLGDAAGPDEIESMGPLGEAGNKYIKGICPEGWHLPSDREWTELARAIYNNPQEYSTITKEEAESWPKIEVWNPENVSKIKIGAAMKSVCIPVSASNMLFNPNGKSYYSRRGGFNALLPGTASSGKLDISSKNPESYFWTSSKSGFVSAIMRSLHSNTSELNRTGGEAVWNLISVRCKKD